MSITNDSMHQTWGFGQAPYPLSQDMEILAAEWNSGSSSDRKCASLRECATQTSLYLLLWYDDVVSILHYSETFRFKYSDGADFMQNCQAGASRTLRFF